MNNLFTFILCCCLPLKHLTVTSAFGYRIHPITHLFSFHNGVDLSARRDTVYAVFDGTASVGYDERLGLFIAIAGGELTCTYGHLSAILISAGPVTSGQAIAITGATGRVTGAHLHFAVKFRGQAIDPLQFLYQLIKK